MRVIITFGPSYSDIYAYLYARLLRHAMIIVPAVLKVLGLDIVVLHFFSHHAFNFPCFAQDDNSNSIEERELLAAVKDPSLMRSIVTFCPSLSPLLNGDKWFAAFMRMKAVG